jgi:hypothetical protein
MEVLMADVQVRCVNKQPRNDPHHGITHLGGEGWKWTRQQVGESIKANTNTFYTLVSGKRANVGVRQTPQGHECEIAPNFDPTLKASLCVVSIGEKLIQVGRVSRPTVTPPNDQIRY